MSRGAGLAAASVAGTLVLAVLLLFDVRWLHGPLAVAGAPLAPSVLRGAWLPLAVFLALLGVFRRASSGGLSARAAVALFTAGSAALGFALHATSEEGLFRVPDGIYSGFDSNYYADTAHFDGPGEVVSRWHAAKPRLSPRSQTHPPGPVLLLATTNAAARLLAGGEGAGGEEPGEPSLAVFRLEGLLPGVLLPLLAALWLPALFAVARRAAGERAALFAVLLGAVLPAPLLMGPGTDALAPLFGVGPLALLVRGWRDGRALATVLAGALFAVALLFGFHYVTAGLPWVLFVLLGARGARDARRGVAHLAAATGVAAGALLLARLLGYDYARDFRASLGFHAEGVTALRSYAAFLFWSPYAFLFWTSLPVALALAAATWRELLEPAPDGPRTALVGVLSVVILDLAGLSRGETERLWLHLLPFVVLPVAVLWTRAGVRRGARTTWLACVFATTVLYKALLVLGLFKV